MRLVGYIMAFVLFGFVINSNAQIHIGELPYSWTHERDLLPLDSVEYFYSPYIDYDSIQGNQLAYIASRFYTINKNISTFTKDTVNNEYALYRYRFLMNGAGHVIINTVNDELNLSEEGRVWAYTPDKFYSKDLTKTIKLEGNIEVPGPNMVVEIYDKIGHSNLGKISEVNYGFEDKMSLYKKSKE